MSEKTTQPLTLEGRAAKQYEETERLRQQQLSDSVETTEANRAADVSIPTHEAGYVHVDFVNKVADPVTETFKETRVRQSFHPEDFRQMKKDGTFVGMGTIDVLHDPDYVAATDGAKLTPKQQLESEYEALFGEKPEKLTTAQLKEAIDKKASETKA